MTEADAMLVIRPELAEFVRIADWTEAFAQATNLPGRTKFAIELCIEEAVSNVIRHGFANATPEATHEHGIRLALAQGESGVVLTIEDDAPAFDPLGVAAPVRAESLEDAAVGGQGVELMRRFARDLAYERRDGVNRLTLGFALA